MMGKASKIGLFVLSVVISLLFIMLTGAVADSQRIINTANSRIALIQNNHNTETTRTNESQNQFHLPSSLISIEERAFEGTSISSLELPFMVEEVADYAFANIPDLKSIRIPNDITYVGQYALQGSDQAIISGTPNGYAQAVAKENGIPFVPITSFYTYDVIKQIMGLTNRKTNIQTALLADKTKSENRQKSTGRLSGDLNASRYENCSAFHIQGRAPPMYY